MEMFDMFLFAIIAKKRILMLIQNPDFQSLSLFCLKNLDINSSMQMKELT